MTKRYILMGGQVYYASGGLYDFLGSFDTIHEAITLAHEQEKLNGGRGISWWHVFCCDRRKVVAVSEWSGFGVQGADPTPQLKELSHDT